MKPTPFATTLTLLIALASAGVVGAQSAASAQEQTIVRAGSQPSSQGPQQNFTGSVRVDPIFAVNADAPYSAAYVHLRARCALGLAHAPGRPAAGGDGRRGPHGSVGRAGRRDQGR